LVWGFLTGYADGVMGSDTKKAISSFKKYMRSYDPGYGVAPTPSPTPEVTATPEPVITAAPEVTPEPVPVKEKGGAGRVIGIIAGIILAGAAAFLALTLYRRRQEKKRREALRRRAAAIRRARMAREAQRNQDK
jgi:peptidoglycan hydrolase-like protein with peptidoglycan-binding domain